MSKKRMERNEQKRGFACFLCACHVRYDCVLCEGGLGPYPEHPTNAIR